jgi:hypothetical protein
MNGLSLRAVNLTPPPTYRQFATERVRTRIKERKAGKKLRKGLDRRAETVEHDPPRVNPLELARIWSSLTLRESRDCLTQSEEDKFRPMSSPTWPARRPPQHGARPSMRSQPCAARQNP